jgi:quercetin dioxygenase-like cupin family protein
MFCRLFWTALSVLFAVHVALAQDPTKVEPRHYRLDFENERVQVVSVHYGPHEKSALHDHPGGVVVVITGGHLRFTDQNGKTQDVFAKAGEARWFPPFKHKVENLGDTPYDAVYVGIKGKLATASAPKGEPTAVDEQTAKLLAAYIVGSGKR